jgi:hypothetical protein
MKLLRSIVLGLLGGSILLLEAGTSRANGRYPSADHLVVNPTNPSHMMMRTTYGVLQTVDNGWTWQWICEGAMSLPLTSPFDPPLELLGDGTAVLSLQFAGVETSRDRGCSWTVAGGDLAGRLVTDLTAHPNNTAGLFAIASTYRSDWPGYEVFIAETADYGRTWRRVGDNSGGNPDAGAYSLPRNLIVHSFEVARRDPNRIYVSGRELTPTGNLGKFMFLRLESRSGTWSQSDYKIPAAWAAEDGGSNAIGAYIAGIDPNNADRVYLRLLKNLAIPDLSPGALYVSHDKGQSWGEPLAITEGPMLGFALSPDGSKLAYGTCSGKRDDNGNLLPGGAVYVGRAPGGPFAKMVDMQNRCLKWTAAGLYACGTEGPSAAYDRFSLALSTDEGRTFTPKYARAKTCQLTCPAGTQVGTTCPAAWPATQTNICGLEPCQCGGIDAGAIGGTGGTGGRGGTSGASGAPGCSTPTPAPAAASCSMGNPHPAALALAGFALVAAALRRRRNQSKP